MSAKINHLVCVEGEKAARDRLAAAKLMGIASGVDWTAVRPLDGVFFPGNCIFGCLFSNIQTVHSH